MPVTEAGSEETPFGRYITSEGWFVHSVGDALAVRNEEKGGAMYPLEPREAPPTPSPAGVGTGAVP